MILISTVTTCNIRNSARNKLLPFFPDPRTSPLPTAPQFAHPPEFTNFYKFSALPRILYLGTSFALKNVWMIFLNIDAAHFFASRKLMCVNLCNSIRPLSTFSTTPPTSISFSAFIQYPIYPRIASVCRKIYWRSLVGVQLLSEMLNTSILKS